MHLQGHGVSTTVYFLYTHHITLQFWEFKKKEKEILFGKNNNAMQVTADRFFFFFHFKIESTFSIQIVEKDVTNSKWCFSLSTKERWTLSWSFHSWFWVSWSGSQAQLPDPPHLYIPMLVYFHMLLCKLVSFSIWFIPASVCVWIFQWRLT